MEYIRLNNEKLMPMVGFGTWALRGDECIKSVETAISCGYRMIDTAIMYQNEKEVGEGIKKSGVGREEVFITSKLDSTCNSYTKAKEEIMLSIERLGSEYIDLFLIHEPYDNNLDMYRALCEAYENGLIKAVGVSNFNKRRLDIFLSECGIIPAVNQIEAHIFYPQLNYVSYLKEKRIATQAWSPLAQGNDELFENVVLRNIGEKYRKTTAQVALRFLLQSGISVVPKTAHEARMKENIDIFDFRLNEDDMQKLICLNKGKTLSPWTEHWK